MAEAVGLAASLLALLGTACRLSRVIYSTVDSIVGAPSHIKAISSDAKAMSSVLGTLAGYLDDEDNSAGVLHSIVAADLGQVLTNSISVLKELQALIGEFVKGESGGMAPGKWTSLRFHFKESDVNRWREQLAAHKITLSVAIAMANLYVPRSPPGPPSTLLRLLSTADQSPGAGSTPLPPRPQQSASRRRSWS